MSATPQKAKEIFVAALKLVADQWDGYLAHACDGDEELRKRVRDLLDANAAAGSFLEPRAVATIAEPIREGPGTIIGPYKMVEQIGEGGFGLVFMAEQQQPVRRTVAIKILKPGMDTRQVIARFEAERQALALMEHPNIARVLDAGETTSGRPHFVMELVRGVPITDYCDQNRLTTRERLELFAHVCLAVQHAHQKGVIHRDIKPSNVMVTLHDDKPVVKVIDFGIAKALGQQLTDKTLVTGFAQMVGTPLYMSPEQAQLSGLDVDTRSDIYSLGVLLYELLTGTTPFDKDRLRAAGYDEMRRIIREEEPAKPSTRLSTLGQAAATVSAQRQSDPQRLSRLLCGDLDWIVLKALEKDRNRRYETASAFAADIQRYLADEPVLACPPSAWYRARKFARRNKAGLQLAAAGALVLLLAVVGVSWALWDQAERKAEQKRVDEKRIQEKREQAYQESLRQADAAAQRNYRAKEMTAVLDLTEKLHKDLHRQLGDPVKVHVLLSDIDSWDRKVKAAGAAWKQAKTLAGTSKEPLAVALVTRLNELDQLLKVDQSDYDLYRKLDTVRLGGATAVDGKGYWRKWGTAYTKVFAEAGYDIRPGEEAAVAAQMQKSALRYALAATVDHWADATTDKKLVPALLKVAKLLDPDPWRAQVRDAVAEQDQQRLLELARQGKLAGQSPQILVMLAFNLPERKNKAELHRQALVYHPGDFWLHYDLGYLVDDPAEKVGCFSAALAIRQTDSSTYINLGAALRLQKNLSGAVDAFNKAISIDSQSAIAYNNLGSARADQQDLSGAVDAFNKAIAIDSQFAIAHNHLGLILKLQKKLPAAEDAFNKAIAINPQYAVAYFNLGKAREAQNNLSGAVDAFNKAIEISPQYAEAYFNLGNALQEQKNLSGAVDAFNKAVAIDSQYADAYFNLGKALETHTNLSGAVDAFNKAIAIKPELAEAHYNLGVVLKAQNDLPGAVAAYKKAIQFKPRFARAYNNLGTALKALKDLPGAVAAYDQAIAIDPKVAETYYNLGNARKAQKNLPRAVAAYKEAVAINPQYVDAHWNLGHAYLAQGQFAEAKQAMQQALKLLPTNAPMHNVGQKLLQQCDELLAVDRKVSAILEGEAPPPAAATEQLQLAQFCQSYKERYRDAADFYAQAFAAEPKAAANLDAGFRYNAACAAALASAGIGVGADMLDAKDRARLRKQSLDWLQADLVWRAQALERNHFLCIRIRKDMEHWRSDPDLFSLRDGNELAKLSSEDRTACAKLWGEVEGLTKKARACYIQIDHIGQLSAKVREQSHALKMTAGKTYVIDMESTQFDTYLRLEEEKGGLVAWNDNISPTDTNSQIVFSPHKDGSYRIVATSLRRGNGGIYTVTVREFAGQKK